jgi:hypothetical protein
MITSTFAGDDSGDFSFNFGGGASRYFVMPVISIDHPQKLRESLDVTCREFNLPAV